MAVTLTRQAPYINHVKNDILFFVNTNNLFSSAGSYASLTIEHEDDPAENDTFLFQWTDFPSISFVFKNSPNTSGTQLPTQGADTTAVWIGKVVTYLKYNYFLNTYYDITAAFVASHWRIVFISRNKGAIYSFDNFVSTAVQFDIVTAINGTNEVIRPNYNIVFQVWVKDGSVFKKAGEEWIPPNTSGDVRFNASDYLQPWITPNFTWQLSTAGSNYFWNKNLRWFYITYGEAYGDIPVVNAMVESSQMIAIPGQIDQHVFEEKYRQHLSSWSAYRNTFNVLEKFLTNQPSEKTITKRSQERLFLPFIQKTANTGFKVKYKLYYTDGTDATVTFADPTNNDTIIEIVPQIYYNLLEQTNPSKEIKKYDVWVERPDGDVISNVQTYVIDTGRMLQEHQILFHNRKGGFDLARLFGVQSTVGVTENDTIAEGPKLENPFERRKISQFNISSFDKVAVNSGYLSREYLDWLYEIAECEYAGAWEVIRNYPVDDIYPLTISSGDLPKVTDRDFVQELVFEYTRERINTNTSKKVLVFYDDMDSAGLWQKKKEDLTTNTTDLAYVSSPPNTGFKFTSTSGLVAVLMWPTGLLSNLCMSGEKYEIVIDVDVPGNEVEVTPYITGQVGQAVFLTSERKTISQTFFADPSSLSDFMVKFRNTAGAPDGRTAFIHSLYIYQCLE